MPTTSRRSVSRCAPSTLRAALHLSIAAACFYAPRAATAATKTWLDTDGLFWNNTAGWSTGVIPVNGDDVLIGTHTSGVSSPTLNFTSNLTGINLNSLKIDSTGVSGTMTFSQALSTSVMNATTEVIGDTIGGNVYTQNAGANNATSITLGNTTSGSGIYNLSATGTVTASVFTVGNSGAGSVSQSAGAVTVNSSLIIASQSNSSGTYALSGTGILNASGEYTAVSPGTTATINQTGGTNTIINNGSLYIGQNGSALYTLSNGTLNVTGNGTEIITYSANANGTFTQTNGNNNATNLAIGSDLTNSGAGYYNLQGGNLTTTATQSIGNGTFTQSGGNNTLNGGALVLGILGSPAFPTYALQTGNLTTSNAFEAIGYSGNGNFTQTGGINLLNLASNFFVGYASTGTGNYSLQNGTLAVSTGGETIGFAGVGTFTQTGGNNSLNNPIATLTIGSLNNSNGVYNLQSGNLYAPNEVIGDNGNGAFNHTGGLNSVTGTLTICLNGGISSYSLSNATLLAGTEIIGNFGITTFTQTSGNNTVSADFELAYHVGSVANYALAGGNLTLTGTASETIGNDGSANFTQGGGNNTIGGGFSVGSASLGVPGYTSNYTLYSGNLTVAGGEGVGIGTTGNFVQWGGVNNANGIYGLNVGGGTFSGTYTLNGGVLNAFNASVSYNGNLTIAGGVANITNYLYISPSIGATYNAGVVKLINGTLNVSSIDVFGVPSIFQWTGGTLGLTAGVTFDPGSNFYFLSSAFGSSLTLNSGMSLVVTGPETVGGISPFTLTLNSNTNDTASGAFTIAPAGTVVQNGGLIQQNMLNQGYFLYYGGIFNGNLTNSGFTNFLASFSSGALINSGTIATLPLGLTLSLSGTGLNNSGTLTLAGGTVTGNITNSGLLSGYGTLGSNTTAFTNSGVITQSGANLLLLSNSTFANTGTLNLASGLTLQFSANTVNNDGTVNLDSGTLTSSIQFVNNPDGAVIGPGKITVPVFINSGTLEVPAGSTTTNSFTNSGLIEMASPAANLGPATTVITNAAGATIEGFGKVSAAVINNGSIEATGGTLTLSGALTNAANGTLRTAINTKLLVQGSFATNAGLINLAGGTFDNGGHTLDNTGTIAGYGVLAASTITNDGAIVFSGGTATINANIVNSANKRIDIRYQPAFFIGNITNSGIIKTWGTTVTYTGILNNLANSSYTSDPSTNIFTVVNNGGSMTGSTGDVYTFLAGGSVSNSGSFINGGTLNANSNITNSGTFTQTGPQTWSSNTTFSNTGGTATFGTDTGSTSTSPLNIVITAGTVNLSATQHLSALTVTTGTAAITTGTTKTTSLTLGGSTNNWTGNLSLSNNKLVVESTALAKSAAINTLQNQAFYGQTHSTGITSNALAANLELAVIDNGALLTPFTTFGGVAVDSNSILVAPELLGDANVDGQVNISDLNTVLSHLGLANTSWTTGNFDGAAIIDLNDLNDVLNNLGSTYANSSSVIAAEALLQASPDTPTPEPASLTFLLPVILLRRRRTSR